MKLHNFFGNGKSQTGTSGIRTSCFIQTEKFLKNRVQLLLWNGFSVICKRNDCHILFIPAGNGNLAPLIAVRYCVFQNIIKNSRQLIPISIHRQGFIYLKVCGISMGRQDGIKLLCHLHQHVSQIQIFLKACYQD